MSESGCFEYDDAAKSCPVSNWTINQYGLTGCRPSFSMAHAPETFYCRGAMGTRVNPKTGCVWTGEFHLNTLRVDGETFESEKKSCGHRSTATFELGGRGEVILLPEKNYTMPESVIVVQTHWNRHKKNNKKDRSNFSRLVKLSFQNSYAYSICLDQQLDKIRNF